MANEIHQIPEIVAFQVAQRAALDVVAEAIRAARPAWISLVARGTSDHAATYGRYLFESTMGIPAMLAAPSLTTIYRAPRRWADGVVLAVSQSGRGPDVRAVIEAARAGGALTVAVVNDVDSPLARAADHVVDLGAGTEHAVAATKTYVAELAALALLGAAMAPDTPYALAVDRLPAVLDRCLERSIPWVAQGDAVPEVAQARRCLVASRGYNQATALEVALKLKETAGIFAEGYSTADLLHGPIALAGPDIPAIIFRPDGPIGARIDEGAARVESIGSPTWVIGGREIGPRSTVAGSRVLALPLDLPEELTPMPLALVGQLLAEAVAVARGMDPDAPAHLTKVTETR
jgi:glucosamine--fructose-6-phosphate aminotransferase (isomerizing)